MSTGFTVIQDRGEYNRQVAESLALIQEAHYRYCNIKDNPHSKIEDCPIYKAWVRHKES